MQQFKTTYWPQNTWQSTEPNSQLKQSLTKADDFIQKHLKSVGSFLVVKNDYIIYEKYYHDYNVYTESHIASITKSVMGTLIGIAIKLGYIDSVGQKISDFFPELDIPKTHDFRLYNLLTMTSGISLSDVAVLNHPDWFAFIMASIKHPGKFNYNDLNAHILSLIITKATGISTQDFAQQHLFRKMNIDGFDTIDAQKWSVDSKGIATGGWGMSLTTRDMAKIAYLYLRNGIWEDQVIIPIKWVNTSIQEHVDLRSFNKDETGYGYFMFTTEIHHKKVYFSRGSEEQYIIICPELDLVTVFKNKPGYPPVNLFKFWRSFVLPYIK